MVQIRSRAPLRLGVSGGGTDVSPYCDIYGGCVLNATIDRYAYAMINTGTDSMVHFVASDLQSSVDLPVASFYELDDEFRLHKAVYNEIIKTYNNNEPIALTLRTYCDAPAGSGLGSSSTLVVAILKAFMELLNIPLDDYSLARLAFRIERIDCGYQGGRQDQYTATFGGFNFMEFFAEDRVIVNPLRIKNWIICELEASMILFYTGVSRESANIIAAQSSNVETGNFDAIEAMHLIKAEAISMKECILKGDFDGVVQSMKQGWENKKRSASTVSNSNIDEIFDAAISAGALAGKVSGAGGGGFMLFYVRPTHRMNVIRTLGKFNGQVSNCHFTKHGAQSWKL